MVQKDFTNSVKFRKLADGHRLVSIIDFPKEFRLEMHLLCVSHENMGKGKRFEGIAGCLIAFVAGIAIEKYFDQACISLLPKTELRSHYKNKYGMLDGGSQLFLEGLRLQAIVNMSLS